MKKIPITKTIVIYNKDKEIIKEVDVTDLPWILVYPRAIGILSSSLQGHSWEVIVKPKPK